MRSLRRVYLLTLLFMIAFAGCEYPTLAPDRLADEPVLSLKSNRTSDQGNKGKKKDEPIEEDEPPLPAPDASYQISISVDSDPLWRFSILGDQILLESDPTVAMWGTDFWGTWSDPFDLVDGLVHYTSGLTDVTYAIAFLPDGTADVHRTLVVQPYPSGDPTTTVTHVGTFALLGGE